MTRAGSRRLETLNTPRSRHVASVLAGAVCRRGVFPVMLAAFHAVIPVASGGILETKHDLSVSSPGAIKDATESGVCVFCHTPHSATSEAPLWNRFGSGSVYIPYSSTTGVARPGQPTGASKTCLSCHDGTIALGMFNRRGAPDPMRGVAAIGPQSPARLGTDLSDDHPVSFAYDAGLATANGELHDPGTLTGLVRVDDRGQLQCTSCHSPHENRYGKFLLVDNTASALCVTCHDTRGWSSSIHSTGSGGHSDGTWTGLPPDPWPLTDYTTVAANGCENCHAPHGSGRGPQLLTFESEEESCCRCHNGQVAKSDVRSEFSKLSIHPTFATSSVHDPSEDPLSHLRHAGCVDCHDPHEARATCTDCHTWNGTKPVTASGPLAGVTGISSSGTVVTPITYQYELCFRCHGDGGTRGPALLPRHTEETNTRLEFQPSNASYHPIVSAGKNQAVPSLVSPWTVSSLMTCTECHNNDTGVQAGGSGPTGPHGSTFEPLLERRQELADHHMESGTVYALCYKCHRRSSILNDESFPLHRLHVVEQRTGCTTCHDPHGVATTSHLLDFNTTYVSPSALGMLEFVDQGLYHGSCFLRCHGVEHDPKSY